MTFNVIQNPSNPQRVLDQAESDGNLQKLSAAGAAEGSQGQARSAQPLDQARLNFEALKGDRNKP
jgi:hypothetical protein